MPLRSGAAKRFAEAVAGLARQDGSWDRWRRDLSTLAGAAADRRLVLSLESQRIAVARKRELIDGAFGEQVSPGARNLVLVLARRQRLGLLPDVLNWFDQLADRAQGVRRYTVTTAAPLTDEQRARLRQRLAAGGDAVAVAAPVPAPDGPEVQLSEEVDPSLLGGLVVRQGDIIQDYSVRARLEALRDRLN
jgi:F-type H+-transporting ATPase subunit delta